MGFMQVVTTDVDIAADIPAMSAMCDDEYLSYLQSDLFFVDHHDVLRCNFGQFPIAATPKQFDVLIAYLQGIRNTL